MMPAIMHIPYAISLASLGTEPHCDMVTELIHQLAESLGKAIDAKDTYTLAHSEEVAAISHIISLKLGMERHAADIIHVAGHLHDLGKIGISDNILKQRTDLTPQEWAELRKHPDIGADILRPISCLRDCGIVEMVRAHHERFDGKGYPQGLAGRQIPHGARIISVADALSAMLQSRQYRPAKTFSQACAELERGADNQFDPEVVSALLASKRQAREQISLLRAGSVK